MILLIFFITALALAVTVLLISRRPVFVFSAIVFTLAQAGLTVFAFLHLGTTDSGYFIFDHLAVFMHALLSLVFIPVIIHTRYYLKRHVPLVSDQAKFLALLYVLAASLSGIYFTDNLLIMWVCFELTTVSITFLVFHERYATALEASWKYLYISSIGITLAFLGILFLSVLSAEGHSVSFTYSSLGSLARELDPLFVKAAFLLIFTGLSIKLNSFPFHAATIDAKTIAPFPTNALSSTVVINAGFLVIFRVFGILSNSSSAQWTRHILLIAGVLSLILVALQLFKVKRFKRMFAFSSMEHVALILIALSLGKPGYYAALLHLALHTLAKAGAFLNFGIIRATYDSGWIRDTGLFFRKNPSGAAAYILGILTLTAIPPSGMFVSELLIFKAMFYTGNYFLAGMAFVLLTIIIYVIFRYSVQLLFGEAQEKSTTFLSVVNPWESVSQFILYGLVIYLAYFPPDFFVTFIQTLISPLN
jgi:hydrogenase-4 component F